MGGRRGRGTRTRRRTKGRRRWRRKREREEDGKEGEGRGGTRLKCREVFGEAAESFMWVSGQKGGNSSLHL